MNRQQRPRIVVGVDGSPGSRAALDHALRDAARRDALVEVVSAITPPEIWMPLAGPPAISLDDIWEGIRQRADETVREVTGQLGEIFPQLPSVTITATTGSAAEALLHAARGAELLVVGSRGHGGFSSMLLSSVSLQCALHAPCPVTVVRRTTKEKADAQAAAEPAPAVGWTLSRSRFPVIGVGLLPLTACAAGPPPVSDIPRRPGLHRLLERPEAAHRVAAEQRRGRRVRGWAPVPRPARDLRAAPLTFQRGSLIEWVVRPMVTGALRS